MKNLLFIVLIALSHFEIALADSPLTSTSFSDPYGDTPVIVEASEANGQITPELMSYIANETNPVDIKVAAINELGWDHEVQNAEVFLDYLKENRGYSGLADFLNEGTGAGILCYSYLKALDNYFDVKDALNYAEIALKKEPQSYTYNIIAALIKAQFLKNYDWCEIYRVTDQVRRNNTLIADMKKEAVDMIHGYTDNYISYCDEEKNPAMILPKDMEGVPLTTDHELWNKSQEAMKEKWEHINNPIELTFVGTGTEEAFHLYFTDTLGQKYDFNGNNHLGEIRLYGARSKEPNPYYVGKMFRITWEWKKSGIWVIYSDWEKVIGMLPSIVEIELVDLH